MTIGVGRLFAEEKELFNYAGWAGIGISAVVLVFFLYRFFPRPPRGAEGERELLWRLRGAMVVWYVSFTLLTVFLLAASVYYSQANIQEGRLKNQVVLFASKEADNEGTVQDLREFAEGEKKTPERKERLYPFILLDPSGKIVESEAGGRNGVFPEWASFRQALAGQAVFVSMAGGKYLLYSYPVTRDGAVLGVIQVAASTLDYRHALGDLLEAFFGAALVAVVLALGLGYFLAGLAMFPVRQALGRQRDFVADASHELRTPLTILRTNAELALRAGTSEAWREALETTVGQTQHMTRLVEELSTLARTDSGQVTLEVEELEMAALAGGSLQEMSALAQAKGIELQSDLHPPLLVLGDEGRLRQMLLILLDNAIKYTSAGGKVTLQVRRRGKKAELSVADTGIGIPADQLGQIFDRFYRIDKARSRDQGGTGLGLAIARWIVRAHGGEIAVASQVNNGSVFTVQLPLGRNR